MAKQGRLSQLWIDPPDGTKTLIDGLTDITLNRELSEAETSHHGSGGNRSFLPDWGSATISGSGVWIEDDDGQAALESAIADKTTCTFYFVMADDPGNNEYEASGFVTELSPNGPNEGPGDFSFGVRLSGAITIGTYTT